MKNKRTVQIITIGLFFLFFFILGILRPLLYPENETEKNNSQTEEQNYAPRESERRRTIEDYKKEYEASKDSISSLDIYITPTPQSESEKSDFIINEKRLYESDTYDIVYYPSNQMYVVTILKNPYYKYREEIRDLIPENIGKTKEELCGETVQVGAPRYVDFNASVNPTTFNYCY